MALTSGCVFIFGGPFDGYAYSGVLCYPDGTPARNVKVFMESIKRAETPPSGGVFYGTTTDAAGCFSGSLITLGRTLREAPRLDVAYLYVERPSGWQEMKLDLQHVVQTKSSTYCRTIALPPIAIPFPETQPR